MKHIVIAVLTLTTLFAATPLAADIPETNRQDSRYRALEVKMRNNERAGRIQFKHTADLPPELRREPDGVTPASFSRLLRQPSTLSADPRIIEEYGEVWNGSGWDYEVRWLYTYDSAGNFIREVRQRYEGGVWVNERQWIMEYDGLGRDTAEVRQVWNGSAWINEFKWIYSYDSGGNLVGEVIESWTTGSWQNYLRWTYTYNGLGDILTELLERWTTGAYENDELYTTTYSGGLEVLYSRDDWTGLGWDPEFQISYTHDGNDNVLTETREDWSGVAWAYSWRYSYAYDISGNDIYQLFEYYLGGWAFSGQDSLYYNGNNQFIGMVHYYYNAGWVTDWKGDFSWNPDGTWMEDIWSNWTGSDWALDERYYPVWEKAGSGQLYAVQDKWNMLSVPLTLGDYSVGSVFPNASSSAFAFTTTYESRTMLENGVGYWLKFDGPQKVSMSGIIRDVDTFTVQSGWNMIGSVSGSVDAASITSNPPGMVTSSFYGFTNMYEASTTIEPGKAYWVKLTGAGTLMLDATGAAPEAGRIRIEDRGELPPPPPGEALTVDLPGEYTLEQNYPNPFNPVTEIHYTTPTDGYVRLSVYNMLGQEVVRLVDAYEPAGDRSVWLRAGNLPSGVYTYRLTSGAFSSVRRMVLMK